MAKQTTQETSSTETKATGNGLDGAMLAPPSSMKVLKTDTEGFWDEDSQYPIYGRLLFAREVTPTKGPSRGQKRRYFVVQLMASTWLKERKGENAKPARAAVAGEVVGMWVAAGMNDLNMAAGCVIWVKKNDPSKFKDVGRGQPMKTYDMRVEGVPKQVQVRPFATQMAEASQAPGTSETATPPGDDEIPF